MRFGDVAALDGLDLDATHRAVRGAGGQDRRRAFIGITVRDPETAQSVGFIWVFPLVFASSAFVPTASMPGVLHTFADINPVTLVDNAAAR
jgi:ABC-2 type transporter